MIHDNQLIFKFAICFRANEGDLVELQEVKEGDVSELPVVNPIVVSRVKGELMQELDQLQMDEFNDFCQSLNK